MQTKVYKYGLLPPVMEGELIAAQLSGAHRYYNKLIEIENARRTANREVLVKSEDVATLTAQCEADAKLYEEFSLKLRARKKAGESKEDLVALREYMRGMTTAFRNKREALKEAKKRAVEMLKGELDVVNEASRQAVRDARASSGVYWGSYLVIEQAVDLARKAKIDPRFRRWTGSGQIAVQLQKGLAWETVLACTDTRLRLDMRPHFCGFGKPQPMLYARIGSVGVKPIWGAWPIVMHRPVPEGSRVLWTQVLRELVAGKEKWSVCFTVQVPEEKTCGRGVVAVDIGWRRKENDTVRVGFAVGEVGKIRNSKEILSHPRILSGLDKASSLRSIRDKNLAQMQKAFVEWLAPKGVCFPNEGYAWLLEATKTITQWSSPARFAALAIEWRKKHRFDGDVEGFSLLEAWRKQDAHLWTWEVHQRRRSLRRRKEEYRIAAKRFAEQHEILVLEKFNLADIIAVPSETSEKSNRPGVRAIQHAVAPGEFRQMLVNAFKTRGGKVVEVEPQYTTQMCSYCGLLCDWDASKELEHKCEHCGAEWDQDYNACRNMLQAYEKQGFTEAAPPRKAKWSKKEKVAT